MSGRGRYLGTGSVSVLFLILPMAFVSGETIKVQPGEDIQNAMDKAKRGDTVLVLPGIYKCDQAGEAFIVFRSGHEGVALKGGGPTPGDVIIDGAEKVLHVIFFDEGLGRDTCLSGFTIRGGLADPDVVLPPGYAPGLRPEIELGDDFYYDGAGIMVYNSAPTIEGNIIVRNRAKGCGGGVSIFPSQETSFFSMKRWNKIFGLGDVPLLFGNVISENGCEKTGAGVDVYFWAGATIVNNLFERNVTQWAGGAIAVLHSSSAEIHNNTFYGNVAKGYGSGIATGKVRSVGITNSIFAFNQGSDVILSKGGGFEVEHSCFYGNEGNYLPPSDRHNLSSDPVFVNGPRGSYYLNHVSDGKRLPSPCIDAGIDSKYAAMISWRTTRTDGGADVGRIDIGYHYEP